MPAHSYCQTHRLRYSLANPLLSRSTDQLSLSRRLARLSGLGALQLLDDKCATPLRAGLGPGRQTAEASACLRFNLSAAAVAVAAYNSTNEK